MHEPTLIPWQKPEFSDKEREYITQALISTWVSGGPFVERFEKEFALYIGKRFAVAVTNGTSALHLAYLSMGLRQKDEVIVPGFFFMSAANIALHMGAIPVFVEIDPKTWCLSALELEKRITKRTKAIVAVHTYGNICDMDTILQVADNHGIPVIEDAAEAFASRYREQQAGSMGIIGCFSFHGSKTITTGEGGMVVTDDKDLYEQMILYRNHGIIRGSYWHKVAGHNFRLTNLQAALGCAQMEKLDWIIGERRRVFQQYKSLLSKINGITLQHFDEQVDPVIWSVAVKLDPTIYSPGRNKIIEELRNKNIEARPGFVAASFMDIYSCPDLPICKEISRQVLCLPSFPSLDNEKIKYICETLSGLRS